VRAALQQRIAKMLYVLIPGQICSKCGREINSVPPKAEVSFSPNSTGLWLNGLCRYCGERIEVLVNSEPAEPSNAKNESERGVAMDDELKLYLDGLAATVTTALREMEARIIAAIKAPHVQLDAVARKLEGEEDDPNSDADRIRAGQ
jgi:hypothetical protein